jgi:outer membrane protein assembly factor BamB
MKRSLLTLAFAALASSAHADIYPMEAGNLRRYNQAQSISHVALPVDVLWSADVCAGPPRSNPVILEDRIVQAFQSGDVCFSRYDGKVLWRSGSWGDQWNPPAYDQGRGLLYQAGMNMGGMSALRASDGTEAWHYYETPKSGCSNLSSCTYWQDKVYVGTASGRIVCLDANTHNVLWAQSVGARTGISTPGLDNGELYLGTTAGRLMRLDALTGTITWQVNTANSCYVSAISLDDTRLFVMTSKGKVECHARSNGALLWSFQTGSFTLSNLSQGPFGLFCSSDDRCIYRLDPSTGSVLWQTCFQGNFARSAPFCAADMVFGSGCVGVFYGLDSSSGTGTWSLNHGGWNSFTDFADADGLIFVCNISGTVYCLHPANSPYPATVTASPTPSVSGTASPTSTLSATQTQTPNATPSSSSTPSDSPTSSATLSASPTITPSGTATSSPTLSQSPSPTASATASSSPTAHATGTATPSPSTTVSPMQSATSSPTPVNGSPTAVPNGLGAGYRDPGPGHCYIAPDPVHGGPCRLVYQMRAPGKCSVRLFQASGDPAGRVDVSHDSGGIQSCEISTQRYAPGIYFCHADLSYNDGSGEQLPLTKFLVLPAR